MADKLPIIAGYFLLSITVFKIDNVNLLNIIARDSSGAVPSTSSAQDGSKPVTQESDEHKPSKPQPSPLPGTVGKDKTEERTESLSWYVKEKFPNSSNYKKSTYLVKSIQFGKNVTEFGIRSCTQTQGRSEAQCSEENKAFKIDVVNSIYEIWKKERDITNNRRYVGHLFSVKILGHSSEDGDEDANNKISKERSDNVRKEITKQIRDLNDKKFSEWAGKRIISTGHGASDPKYNEISNRYDEVMSRRVEILIEVNEMP